MKRCRRSSTRTPSSATPTCSAALISCPTERQPRKFWWIRAPMMRRTRPRRRPHRPPRLPTNRTEAKAPTTGRRLVWRIVRFEKGDRRLQHLQPGFAARQPVILVFHGRQLDGFSGALQCAQHHVALLKGNNRVVAPVDQQYRHVHRTNMFDRRDGGNLGIVLAGNPDETIPIPLTYV